jgi:hypothetical protein
MAGAPDLQLPPELQAALDAHLGMLRQGFERRGWGRHAGYGRRPAAIISDLAPAWTAPVATQFGGDLGSVIASTARIPAAARTASVLSSSPRRPDRLPGQVASAG